MPALSPSLVGVDALLEASALFLGAPLPLTGFSIDVTLKESSHSCGVGAPFGHLVRPWYQDDAGPLAPHWQWHETARRQKSHHQGRGVARGRGARQRGGRPAEPTKGGASWREDSDGRHGPSFRRASGREKLCQHLWENFSGSLGA